MFHADGHTQEGLTDRERETDMTKPVVDFRNSANTPVKAKVILVQARPSRLCLTFISVNVFVSEEHLSFTLRLQVYIFVYNFTAPSYFSLQRRT